MIIGLLQVELFLPSVHSLKHKRQIIKSIVTRVRNKFNVSISETGNNDLWQRASISACIVTNESKYANQVMEKVVVEIERNLDGQVLDVNTSIL
ncbi:MAG: DUF503 domain-containing protein [candidate division Zixibacteria bacterium]|jgi:uncharacterized protein YlxP (DUF503 family)|nr:DUF503 domain-containing protein [candidate division Zixibacteria bacterium]NIR63737.1 DUF503 domain-containing protein [candidate division Zixibacteria bacterium]NIS14694.1 DUF503 domain-containing protein [candidate division Zixibacteria bacterium]NIS45693.1 DUF503 domain-containing protein [candidate division Zixibacteria bacterium]NIT51222.1 DUF503 domain-containing protein [candidate division Zixibacteria bacterium]